jgi:L-ascorbate metabolism protein UlaG (beta-lactamase superfamily)
MKLRRWLKMIFLVLAALLIIVVGLFYISTDSLSQFGAKPSGARLERMKQSPNFDGKKVINPIETDLVWTLGDYWKMISRQLSGGKGGTPKVKLPVVQLDRTAFQTLPECGLRVTWMGHSSLLIEIDGVRLLTDPVWSERCSPSSLVGPKRFHPVPILLEELPPLDAVLISHDHFDHLDMNAILKLATTGVKFIVPLGVGSHLDSWNINAFQIVELDWYDSFSVGDSLQIVATPARHFSGRAPWRGMNTTLFASFAIIGPRHRVFFSGDTGEFPGLAEIGERFGPFDITCIKIGAYSELWPDIHLKPEKTVKAHLALRGDVLLPIHWGTFNLAFHDWFEPPERLVIACRMESVRFAVPRPGESVSPAGSHPTYPWWREYK